MGDVFQVLIILGFIGFAIFKQITKSVQSEPERKQPDVPFGMEEVFPEIDLDSFPAEPEAPPVHPSSLNVQQFKAGQKKTQHKKASKPGEVKKSPLEETENVRSEFEINSIDEVRKGIIWSEILHRKYDSN